MPCKLGDPSGSQDQKNKPRALAKDGGLRLAVDAAGIGTWDWDLNTDQFNGSSAAKAFIDVPADDRMSFNLFLATLHPDDRSRVSGAIKRSIESFENYNVECRVMFRGTLRRWLRAAGGILRDEKGRASRLVGVVLDISDQKWSDEELTTRGEHLRSILETAPDGMIVIDERGIIRFFSSAAERLFGYAEAEALGQNVGLLMLEADRGQHDSHIERYKKTGERRVIGIGRVVTGRRKDGSTFNMHLCIGEARAGTRRYFTGFARDLTEHEENQARLQELQAELAHVSRLSAMNEMTSALAHELNQPLAAIGNYMHGAARLLARTASEQSLQIRQALDKAADQALRAGQIIRRLRDFVSRRGTDKTIERLSMLVHDAAALALIGARQHGIMVRFNLDPACDFVVADRVQIQQVLVNLLRNAVEAMRHSDQRELAVLSAAAENGMIEISISDTGHGIQDDVMRKIFQPFETTKASGMGVGLSISRVIIESHGGRIWVSRHSRTGTTFHFTLPAAKMKD